MATYLLDTNILLRMSDATCADHLLAGQSVAKLLLRSDEVYLTAQNLIEFWAVATRPANANGLGWTTQQTALEIEAIQHKFPLLPDSPDILSHWLLLVKAHDIKGKKVHDARLVAVMITHSIANLLTFNVGDFKSFTNITAHHPNDIT